MQIFMYICTTGYVAGEVIVINGYVKNFSKTTIRFTKIVLLETVEYVSRGKLMQTEKRELAHIKFPKIRPGNREEFVNETIHIPPLPPTNVRNSNLIRLNYDIYVSIYCINFTFYCCNYYTFSIDF